MAHLDFLPSKAKKISRLTLGKIMRNLSNTLKALVPERVAEFLAEDKADSKVKQLHPKTWKTLSVSLRTWKFQSQVKMSLADPL